MAKRKKTILTEVSKAVHNVSPCFYVVYVCMYVSMHVCMNASRSMYTHIHVPTVGGAGGARDRRDECSGRAITAIRYTETYIQIPR